MPWSNRKYSYEEKPRALSLREAGKFLGFSVLSIMLVLFILGFVAYASQTQAAVGINQQLNYQGKLSDSNGVAVSNGDWNFKFEIYDSLTDGNLLWTERWTATTTQVSSVNGVFSVTLGSLGQADSLGDIDWNSDSLFLQVDLDADVDVENIWEETFGTRKRITSAGYAFNADMLDGFHATTTATAGQLLALDDNLGISLNSVTTTDYIYAGTKIAVATTTPWAGYKLAVVGDIVNTGNLYTLGNLQIDGNATTTNFYVTSGLGLNSQYINSWSDLSALGIGGNPFDQWLDSTSSPAFANLTLANLSVSSNATTTGYLTIGTAPTGALFTSGNLNVQNSITTGSYAIFGGYASSTNLYTSGVLHVGSTSVFDGLVSGSGFNSSVNTLTDARITSNWRGLDNGLASLGADGKVPNSQLSPLAIGDTFVVASEAEMLALSTAETGDVAIRTDEEKSYILNGTYSILSDWKELLTPTDSVISVNGDRGVVVLSTDDISEGLSNLYYTNTKVDERITGNWQGIANGLASLGANGKIPTSQLPDITINDTYIVADQAERLALSATVGDIAVQTDVSKTYVLSALPASTDGNWIELLNTAAVTSVNSLIGDVTLTTTNINEGSNLYWTNSRFDERLVATTTWSGNLELISGNLGIGIDPSYPLEVVGVASTTDNMYIGQDLYVGHSDSTDSDTIYFDQGAQNLLWNNTNSRFELSASALISGNATTTGYLTIGTAPTDALFASGNLNVQNNITVGGYASSTTGLYTQGSGHYGGSLTVDGTVTGSNLNIANWDSAYTHIGESGASHTYIDQSVVSGASPTFTGTNITGVPAASILAGTFGTGSYIFDTNVTTTNHFEADSTLYVKDSKVGIGTASPQGEFEIYSAVVEQYWEDSTASARDLLLTVNGNDAIFSEPDTSSNMFSMDFLTFGSAIGRNYAGTSAPADGLIVEGNVGIASSTPHSKLSVEGDLYVNSAAGQGNSIGYLTTADGDYGAFAVGFNSYANARTSFAAGRDSTADAQYSFVLGYGNASSTGTGLGTLALGSSTSVQGSYGSIAMGNEMTVTGRSSVGIGIGNPAANYMVTNDSVMAIMGGNVGIGDTSPDATLDVVGDAIIGSGSGDSILEFHDSGTMRWRIFNDFNSEPDVDRLYIVDEEGTLGSGGGVFMDQDDTSWSANSDIRFKENLVPVEDALSKILNLTAYTYNFIDVDKREIGLIAQEVEPYFPEIVSSQGEHWGLKYDRVGPILIQAIKEQYNQVLGVDSQLQSVASSTALLTQSISDQEIALELLNTKVDNLSVTPLVENPNPEPLIVTDYSYLSTQTLIVSQAATFYGTIYVYGEAGFEHKVVFKDEVEFQNHIIVDKDTAGTIIIPANATSTEVVFGSEYGVTPRVVASLNELTNVIYAITERSNLGFRLSVLEPVNQDISFDWIALAVKQTGEPPVINNLISSLELVEFDEAVSLIASVSDPDTDLSNLTYSWSTTSNLGFFAGTGNSVFWTIGEGEVDSETEVTIKVTVSDGSNSVTKSKVVTIIIPEEDPEEPTIVLGCTDELALNYDDQATEDDGLCLYEETLVVVLGCTDKLALNYNPEANEDDESCTYEETLVVVLGCMDKLALNYDPTATEDDGLCEYEEVAVLGCMDELALNYNSEATKDDGDCEYEPLVIAGCTDETALNYNPEANEDDGRCTYEEIVQGEGEEENGVGGEEL